MAMPVWCVLVDDELKRVLGDAFYVNVSFNGFIYDLQKKIRKEKPMNTAHVDADELRVWKLRNPRPDNVV